MSRNVIYVRTNHFDYLRDYWECRNYKIMSGWSLPRCCQSLTPHNKVMYRASSYNIMQAHTEQRFMLVDMTSKRGEPHTISCTDCRVWISAVLWFHFVYYAGASTLALILEANEECLSSASCPSSSKYWLFWLGGDLHLWHRVRNHLIQDISDGG